MCKLYHQNINNPRYKERLREKERETPGNGSREKKSTLKSLKKEGMINASKAPKKEVSNPARRSTVLRAPFWKETQISQKEREQPRGAAPRHQQWVPRCPSHFGLSALCMSPNRNHSLGQSSEKLECLNHAPCFVFTLMKQLWPLTSILFQH
ncbi:uncharacterized protein [Desmodus rotundus]|uniref:uncharacterized protein isoform X3 n=1 Tax=Desmodus rotundus TaxID=9430 RepID=UPI0039E6E7C6